MDLTRLRRLLPYAVGLAALVVLLVVVLLPGHGSASLDDRTQDVAGRLRCPTCVGESAADSTSPVAESMRTEIRRQLAAGRSDDQVVDWFRSRYGSDIVLDPQRHGLGWVLWVAPPAAAVAVAAGLWVVRRRGASGAEASERPSALPARRLPVVLGVSAAAAVAVPLLALDGHGGGAAATGTTSSPEPSTTASAEASQDPVTEAFALLKAGQPAAAEQLVRGVAHRPGRDRPLGLLVLGLAQRAEGEPAADQTLQRFVRRYPHHPAAAQVRRLLASG